MADFADCAIAVVGEGVHDDGHAAGAVALEGDFFVANAFQFAGTTLDGPLDVVLRHAAAPHGNAALLRCIVHCDGL